MAIQTRGFTGVQSPTITVADPRLVAFQPDQLARGIGQAFQLAGQYEQVKAAQAERQEKALLAEKRIAAAQANYDKETKQALADIGIVDQLAAAKAAEAQRTLQTNQGIIDATNFGNKVRSLESGIAIDTAPARRETAMMAAEGEAARAAQSEDVKNAQLDFTQGELLSGLKLQPQRQALSEIQLQDQFDNLLTDSALKRETAKAQLENIKSETDARRIIAEARKLEAEGAGKGAEKLQKEAAGLEARIRAAYATKVNGIAVNDYMRQRYDPETGKPKVSGFKSGVNTVLPSWLETNATVETQPEMESRIKDIQKLESAYKTLLDNMYPTPAEAAPQAPAQAAAPSAQPAAQPARLRLRFGPDRKLIDSTGK